MINSIDDRLLIHQPEFLPMSRADMVELGWDEIDILLICGDAYVDHPSFGTALLGRWLVDHGYRVGVIAQPKWDSTEDVEALGRPRLFAGVSAGALDSMLAHYTAFRKKRSDDAYTPGGLAGVRPNRATIVYTNLVKQAFPGLPVVIGGIEASLRRASHYDFWSDSLRRSILLDSKADLLLYGMAERAILDTADRLNGRKEEDEADVRELLKGIPGTVFIGRPGDMPENALELPSHEDMENDPTLLMTATRAIETQVHQGENWLYQKNGDRLVVITSPSEPLSSSEMDRLYAAPYRRTAHPSYKESIPAAEMICMSITTHRGCGGGCSFCSLALHQGRAIRSRSAISIINEAIGLTKHPDWKGSISDVGGPSANMWGAYCEDDWKGCNRESCLHPSICKKFKVDQLAIISLLQDIKNRPRIKNLRVASGVRFDLALKDYTALNKFFAEFVGGQLKVAPEHISDNVLKLMRKPNLRRFQEFLDFFQAGSLRAGRDQYVIPYLMSAFPGCTDEDMELLSDWLMKKNWRPQQVQCFVPTPGTVATAMYYGGIDQNGEPIHVARTDAERLKQHNILMGKWGDAEARKKRFEESAEEPVKAPGRRRIVGDPERTITLRRVEANIEPYERRPVRRHPDDELKGLRKPVRRKERRYDPRAGRRNMALPRIHETEPEKDDEPLKGKKDYYPGKQEKTDSGRIGLKKMDRPYKKEKAGGFRKRDEGFGKREGGFRKRDEGFDKREGGFRKRDDGFDKREGGFRRREEGFGKREGGFRKRDDDFGKREGGFRKRDEGFGKREGGFRKREDDFGKREGGFRKRDEGFDKREGGFRKRDDDFDKREGGFRRREEGFGKREGGFRKRDEGFDKREGGFRKRDEGFGKREGGFRKRDEGFGKREGGFRKREDDFGKREGGFRKRDDDFGKREGGFRKREDGFDKREGGFRKREDDFGKREGGFRKRDDDFGKREGGFRKREDGFDKREGGFRKRDEGFGKREGGFRKREEGFRKSGEFKKQGWKEKDSGIKPGVKDHKGKRDKSDKKPGGGGGRR